MKTNILIAVILLVLNISPMASQVGVNINQPLGVFHIDPKGDTTGSTGLSDDLIVDNTGRMGINTTTPTAKLDVVGTMRIVDGSQGNAKVLTSDNIGVGTWKPVTYTSKIDGVVPASLATIKKVNNAFTYVGANITLPAGQWQIYFYCIYNNDENHNMFTIWWDLSTSMTYDPYNDSSHWVTERGRVLSYYAPIGSLCPTYASYAVSHTSTTSYYIHALTMRSSTQFSYHSGARIWAIPVY